MPCRGPAALKTVAILRCRIDSRPVLPRVEAHLLHATKTAHAPASSRPCILFRRSQGPHACTSCGAINRLRLLRRSSRRGKRISDERTLGRIPSNMPIGDLLLHRFPDRFIDAGSALVRENPLGIKLIGKRAERLDNNTATGAVRAPVPAPAFRHACTTFRRCPSTSMLRTRTDARRR